LLRVGPADAGRCGATVTCAAGVVLLVVLVVLVVMVRRVLLDDQLRKG